MLLRWRLVQYLADGRAENPMCLLEDDFVRVVIAMRSLSDLP